MNGMKRERSKPKQGNPKAFQMPSVQTMLSRKSSITNAFVNSIIPVIQPSSDEVASSLRILKIDPGDLRCAYCGDKATEWDHLRPLVLQRRPTGFISEIANLVPCCGKCNQSKGNKNWRAWMLSNAKLSPASRGVPDLEERVRRLEDYERWREVEPIDFGAIAKSDGWSEYWAMCESVVAGLRRSQELAERLKAAVIAQWRKARRSSAPRGST